MSNGIRLNVRFATAAAFGAALLHCTGSNAHRIQLQRRAQARGWRLTRHGLMDGGRPLAGRSEASIYRRLGLAFIPPELRENRGEVAAAERSTLPHLIDVDDIRGDLHAHTNVTDGTASIERMAEAAHRRGFAYFAITDHSKRVAVANGLDEAELLAHADAIRRVAERYDDMLLLAGVEVDILSTGRLDLDLKVLAELDWVIASVHYDLDMSEQRMTDRVVAAISSGVVDAIAHPFNRWLGRRTGIHLDFDRVIRACLEHDVRLEINAKPARLDLSDIHARRARDAGIGFTIGSDAHRPSDLDRQRFGVYVARRAWLRAADVLNTRSRARFEASRPRA